MVTIRPFTIADIPFGMQLCGPAGWNQLEEDWRRALVLQPDGCFLAERDGLPAGTTTTCLFGDVAWIAMVLVDTALRGQGIGTALMRHALRFLDEKRARSVWLDATPLGRPIYEKLGFEMEGTFYRYAGECTPLAPRAEGRLQNAASASGFDSRSESTTLADVLSLDRSVYGYDRSALLRGLPELHTARVAYDNGVFQGFCVWRPGARAWKVGPCLANVTAGPALLADALEALTGQQVYVDVPEENVAAAEVARRAGLQVQRPLYRMRRGEPIPWQRELIWSTFGPEKG